MNAFGSRLRTLALRSLAGSFSGRVSLPNVAPGAELSVIMPVTFPTNKILSELFQRVFAELVDEELDPVRGRSCESVNPNVFQIFSGEHYRFLCALVKTLKPRRVLEVGTFTGLSALVMMAALDEVIIETFDLQPWNTVPGCVLLEDDFSSGRIRQHLADLSIEADWLRYESVLDSCEVFFLDGPKDGIFEPRFIDKVCARYRGSGKLLVIDDIRTFPMIKLWSSLNYPKIDITSFAHWSGTGIVLL